MQNTEPQKDEDVAHRVWDLVHESASKRVYRYIEVKDKCNIHYSDDLKRTPDKRIVAVKIITDECPCPKIVSTMFNEYRILKETLHDCSATCAAIKTTKIDGCYGLYLEWAEGDNLQKWIETKSPLSPHLSNSIITVARLAYTIAKAISEVHMAGVAHNNLTLKNIIVRENPERNFSVKIIGFGSASLLPSECLGPFEKNRSSQENKRRRNSLRNSLNCRTKPLGSLIKKDLRSLGSLFHIMFSKIKKDEFDLDDMSDITCNFIIPDYIPDSIYDLLHTLEKCNEHAVNEGYKSAKEVEQDLLQILENPDLFILKENQGFPNDELVLNSMVGRVSENRILQAAYKQVHNTRCGKCEVLLVSGHAGVGKSLLMESFQEHAAGNQRYFAIGKFDQQQKKPYSAIVTAITNICNIILTQEEPIIDDVGTKIRNAVGNEGKILTDLIPNLTKIIGEPPDLLYLSGKEAQNRFKFVFRNFIKAISVPSNPVVLMLDDLQWADLSSLDLILNLVSDSAQRPLLLIGCYRDTEITADHPLAVRLDMIEQLSAANVTKLHLRNLNCDLVVEFISRALHLPRRLTRSLADDVYRKTNGNPLFVAQFLKSLRSEGLLYICPLKQRWHWNIGDISKRDIPDNVVEFVEDKVKKRVPTNCQNILKLLSCVGSSFDTGIFKYILRIMNKNSSADPENSFFIEDLLESLDVAIEEGLIIRKGMSQKYSFAHDRIHQAIYSLIPKDKQDEVHLDIGMQLCAGKTDELKKNLFVAVNQLNLGSDLIECPQKRRQLVELNLEAAEKATKLSAYEMASNYLRAGMKMLCKDPWKNDYEITLELYTSLAECDFINGNFKEMEPNIRSVIDNGKTIYDQVRAYSVLVNYLGAQRRVPEALETGFFVLENLGEKFPKQPKSHSLYLGLMKTRIILRGKSPEFILNLPMMKIKSKQIAMSFMSKLLFYSYISEGLHFLLIIFRMINLTIRYGIAPESASGFCVYGGAILSGSLGDYRGGFTFGQLALSLNEKYGAKQNFGFINFAVRTLNEHWCSDLCSVVDRFHSGYEVGMETGDIQSAMLNLHQYSLYSFFYGSPLEQLQARTKIYLAQMTEYKQETIVQSTLQVWICMKKFMGLPEDSNEFSQVNDFKTRLVKFRTYWKLLSMWLAYIFGNYDHASNLLLETTGELNTKLIGKVEVWHFTFYEGLIAIAMARASGNKKRRHKWKNHAKKVIKKVRRWSNFSPGNCLHKLHLLKAEYAALGGRFDEAFKLYEMAIDKARSSGFLHDVALAHERGGIFLNEAGYKDQSLLFFEGAHHSYVEWGAHAKASQLEKRYLSGDISLISERFDGTNHTSV